MTLKNRGRSKKTGGGGAGGQGQKAGAVVWQWVPTFKEAVPPPGGAISSPYLPSAGVHVKNETYGIYVTMRPSLVRSRGS